MFKKYLILILTILIINISLSATTFADTREEKVAKSAEKVKLNVAKLGTGKEAKVEVKLKDGTKLKGYISQVNDRNFVVADEKTGKTTEVPYSRAKQVKGNNLSTGVKIVIVVAVIAIIGVVGSILFAQ